MRDEIRAPVNRVFVNGGFNLENIPQITRYAPRAIYLIVSNPVDIMTYVFHKVTDISENRIMGSGTILDTARLRSTLSMVGNRGVKTRMPADLTPAEEELLRHSAKCLRDVIDQVKF